MKQVNRIATGLCLFALGAAAQDVVIQDKAALDKMKAELQNQLSKVTLNVSGVMGKPVTGAPYSAEEVRETTQTLADGTRIHNQNATTVYRDGEGRMRRETPNEVTIFDPVAGVSYTLNPKTQTARKMPVNLQAFTFTSDRNATFTAAAPSIAMPVAGTVQGYAYTTITASDTMARVTTDDANETQIQMAKKAAAEGQKTAQFQAGLAAGKLQARKAGNREDLGTQVIEGVVSQGTRTTTTIDANTIGNDRPIQIVNESWFSPDLQTTVMTTHSDPRTGEETFRVINIRRGEPGQNLFQPPANYQIIERK